jgi:hypothetical protein
MAATEEQLARERSRAPLAAAGAAVAAVLPLVGGVAIATTARDQPEEKTGQLLFLHDHATAFTVSGALLALGAFAMIVALLHLYDATKARRPGLPRVAKFCALFGPAGFGIGQVGLQLVLVDRASKFADPVRGDQTYEEAKALLESGSVRFFQFLLFAATLALGFALVMIALNAMRVGLLTRFMGILGIIVGVLMVIPLAPGPPVVQSFWLAALTALFLGRWPSGVPPAWKTGEAVPWPSQQELREQREAARGVASPPEPEPAAAGGASATAPNPSASKKRRRKKRRS